MTSDTWKAKSRLDLYDEAAFFILSKISLISKFFNQKSAILFALLPSLFLDHWLWSSHFGILFFFLLLGFAARKG